jgi:prepilin-type processing-associated H-X9-DG protein
MPLSLGGRNNYYSNSGNQPAGVWGATGDPTGLLPKADGPFVSGFGGDIEGVGLGFKDLKDGAAQTVAFSEKRLGDGTNSIATLESDSFRPGTYPSTPDEARQQCLALVDPTVTPPGWQDLSKQGSSSVGTGWMNTGHSSTTYHHALRPNEPSCIWPPGRRSTAAGSCHPGGVNALMCDASVRFFEDEIDIAVWRGLATRAGKENLGKF